MQQSQMTDSASFDASDCEQDSFLPSDCTVGCSPVPIGNDIGDVEQFESVLIASPERLDESAYERQRRHNIARNRLKLFQLGLVDTLLACCGVGPPKRKRAPKAAQAPVVSRRSTRIAALPSPDYMETPAPQVSLTIQLSVDNVIWRTDNYARAC